MKIIIQEARTTCFPSKDIDSGKKHQCGYVMERESRQETTTLQGRALSTLSVAQRLALRIVYPGATGLFNMGAMYKN